MLVQRLASGEWFTARVSACGLFAAAYQGSNKNIKVELRGLFSQLCHDETPMVRRAAAQNLGKFVDVVESEFVSSELFPRFNELTQDGEHLV